MRASHSIVTLAFLFLHRDRFLLLLLCAPLGSLMTQFFFLSFYSSHSLSLSRPFHYLISIYLSIYSSLLIVHMTHDAIATACLSFIAGVRKFGSSVKWKRNFFFPHTYLYFFFSMLRIFIFIWHQKCSSWCFFSSCFPRTSYKIEKAKRVYLIPSRSLFQQWWCIFYIDEGKTCC